MLTEELNNMIEAAELRTAEQNDKMWPMLRDISKQVKWPVNGAEGYLADEDWKDIFSADLKKEQRIAQGLSGGFVLLGVRTKKLKKREMSDMIEMMYAFGANQDPPVRWTDPKVIAGMP